MMKKLLVSLLSIFMMCFASSCKDEAEYSIVTFYYSCSPDFLETCIPEFYSLEDSTNVNSESPKAQDFIPTGRKILVSFSTVNGDSITTEVDEYAYKIVRRFYKQSGVFLLSAILKYTGDQNIEDKEYQLFNGFSQVTVDLYNDKDILLSSKTTPIPLTGILCDKALKKYLYIFEEMQSIKLLAYSYEHDKDKNDYTSSIGIGSLPIPSNNDSVSTNIVTTKYKADFIASGGFKEALTKANIEFHSY